MSKSVFKIYNNETGELEWFFWNDTWADAFGPFKTEKIAALRLNEYYQWLINGEH